MADRDLLRQLAGWRLTTAEILYRLPDHPALLQTYVWQDYDQHPRFPRLRGFLDFWASNIDGGLYRVRVAHAGLVQPREMIFREGELLLH